jgi:hypothetical protein
LEKKWFVVYWDISATRFSGPYDDKESAVNEAIEECDNAVGDLFASVFTLDLEAIVGDE